MNKRTCIFEGCQEKHYAKNYCRVHYQRNKTWGTPEGAPEKIKPLCHCGKKSKTKGLCATHYARHWRRTASTATVREYQNHSVTYLTAHYRLSRELGYAGLFTCVDCGNQASEWSLRHDANWTIEDEEGRLFSPLNNDYQPRCRSCHAAHDAKFGLRRNSTGEHAGTGARADYSPNLQGEPHRDLFTGTPAERFTNKTFVKDESGRECTACETYKPWNEFYDSGRGSKQARCIECVRKHQNERNAERRAAA